jgi:hypothetical protein
MSRLIGHNPNVTTRCMGCGQPSLTAFCDACAPPDPSQFQTNNGRRLSQETISERPLTLTAFGNNRGRGVRKYKKPEE